MGQAVVETGRLMYSGPSKAAEAIAALFVPPACREEVLGDLRERCSSPRQYAVDALRTIPLVIISRIRRTADPQVLLIQASPPMCRSWARLGSWMERFWASSGDFCGSPFPREWRCSA